MCQMPTITLEQFSTNAKVSIKTIQRNYRNIPGITRINDEFLILSGTRYPFHIGKYAIDSAAEKRYALLRAISMYGYIDCYALRLEETQFKNMLRDLLSAGLIEENGLPNHFGANAYDCTELGAQIASKKKKNAIQAITNSIAEAIGHFTGALLSEITPQ